MIIVVQYPEIPINLKEQPPEVFFKKDVLNNFAKFTGKYFFRSFPFNKDVGLRPAACKFMEIDTPKLVLSYKFCEIFKNTVVAGHLQTICYMLIQIKKQSNQASNICFLISAFDDQLF